MQRRAEKLCDALTFPTHTARHERTVKRDTAARFGQTAECRRLHRRVSSTKPGWAARVCMRWPGHAQLHPMPSDDEIAPAHDSAARGASALKSSTSRRKSVSATAADSCFLFPSLVLHWDHHRNM